MYDMVQLEEQWRRYRLRKYLKFSAIAAIFLVIFSVVSLWYFDLFGISSSKIRANKHVVKNDTTPPVEVNATIFSSNSSIAEEDDNSRKKHGWNMVFNDDESEGLSRSSAQSNKKSTTKKVNIELTTRKNSLSAKEIVARYRFAKNKDDALFLARFYYEKKQYKDSLNWALETNKLDSEIEESWLIFARSKVMLGKRMEAIRILQAYFDRTGSSVAKSLLNKIRLGKKF